MTEETAKPDRAALYERTCAAMLYIVHQTQQTVPTFDPKFALQPEGVAVFACIDEVPGIARNEDARLLVEYFCKIGCQIGGPNGQPSLFMLAAVLEQAGIAVERVSLDELGIQLITEGEA